MFWIVENPGNTIPIHLIFKRRKSWSLSAPLAEEKIKELIHDEEEDVIGLRIYVKGGGCSGYQYGMSFESKMDEDDTVIEKGEVKVIVDSQSAPMLSGAEVDYVDSLQGSGFAIKKPASEEHVRLRQFL